MFPEQIVWEAQNDIEILVGQAVLELLSKTKLCPFWSITQFDQLAYLDGNVMFSFSDKLLLKILFIILKFQTK